MHLDSPAAASSSGAMHLDSPEARFREPGANTRRLMRGTRDGHEVPAMKCVALGVQRVWRTKSTQVTNHKPIPRKLLRRQVPCTCTPPACRLAGRFRNRGRTPGLLIRATRDSHQGRGTGGQQSGAWHRGPNAGGCRRAGNRFPALIRGTNAISEVP